MNFYVLTLFPDMVRQGLDTSIIGRAMKEKHISLETVNIRDFSDNKHNRVDDYPYGGGAGMVMQAEPVYRAYCSVAEKSLAAGKGRKPRCIYLTPQGKVFNQTMVEDLAQEEELIFLCGHYEGIDERVLEEIRDGLCLHWRLCAHRRGTGFYGHDRRYFTFCTGCFEQ